MEEINAFKSYLAEGGRIIYVADRAEYYGTSGRAALDQFLADMGSGAQSMDGGFDCGGYRDVPLGGLAPHRLTDGVTSIRVRCTGALATDPRDFILFRNTDGTKVTGASVAVTTLPLAAHHSLPRR